MFRAKNQYFLAFTSEMDNLISKQNNKEINMDAFKLPHDHGSSHNAELLHSELSNSERFCAVAELFRQLSEPARIRIFWLLSHREECVINISSLDRKSVV